APRKGWSVNIFTPAATRNTRLSSSAIPLSMAGVDEVAWWVPVTKSAIVMVASAARCRVSGLSPVDRPKAISATTAIAAARRRLNASGTINATIRMKSARPDLEKVRGSTTAHATAAAKANQGGDLRAAKSRTAAHAQRVRKRAVMFGSAKVMLTRWATAGFGAQICAWAR